MFQKLYHEGAKSIAIQSHVSNYRSGHLSLPKWQRNGQKIWEGEYRSDLIESIMSGIDIPKIYLGLSVDNPKTLIIDGGHRTRCLTEYMEDRFPWKTCGISVYYSKIPLESRNTRAMTDIERNYFDNYKLTIVRYVNITEKNARLIFNRLQNAAPMAMADIINSYESALVDFFREDVRPWLLEGHSDYKHLVGFPSAFKKPYDMNEDLYQLLSWYTIINPKEDCEKTPEQIAFDHVEMCRSRSENPCFRYLLDFDDDCLTETKKVKYKTIITAMRNQLLNNPKLNNAEISSLLYAIVYIPDFSERLFTEFMRDIQRYKDLEAECTKYFRVGQNSLAQARKTDQDNLDEIYDGNLLKWQKSKKTAGMQSNNMVSRNMVLCLHCTEVEGGEQEVYEMGEDLGDFKFEYE
jgi:hypothetical protein